MSTSSPTASELCDGGRVLIDQPYGVRDCAFRDPAGNMLRFNQPRG